MKEQYLLKSRNGLFTVLNQMDGPFYYLYPCPGPYTVHSDSNSQLIMAVDPAGGPFISEGFELEDAVVESISRVNDKIIAKLKKKEIRRKEHETCKAII